MRRLCGSNVPDLFSVTLALCNFSSGKAPVLLSISSFWCVLYLLHSEGCERCDPCASRVSQVLCCPNKPSRFVCKSQFKTQKCQIVILSHGLFFLCFPLDRTGKHSTMPDSPADVKTQSRLTPPTMPPPPSTQGAPRNSSYTPTTCESDRGIIHATKCCSLLCRSAVASKG